MQLGKTIALAVIVLAMAVSASADDSTLLKDKGQLGGTPREMSGGSSAPNLVVWGGNDLGQLGDGTCDFKAIPDEPMFSRGIKDIASNGSITVAVTSDGGLMYWGGGCTQTSGLRFAPAKLNEPTAVKKVVAGGSFFAFLDGNNEVWIYEGPPTAPYRAPQEIFTVVRQKLSGGSYRYFTERIPEGVVDVSLVNYSGNDYLIALVGGGSLQWWRVTNYPITGTYSPVRCAYSGDSCKQGYTVGIKQVKGRAAITSAGEVVEIMLSTGTAQLRGSGALRLLYADGNDFGYSDGTSMWACSGLPASCAVVRGLRSPSAADSEYAVSQGSLWRWTDSPPTRLPSMPHVKLLKSAGNSHFGILF